MVWYNPRTWFKEREQTEDSGLELRCANPQCNGLIREDTISYIPEFNEFYHVGDCPRIAVAHKSGASCLVIGDVRFLSRKRAIELVKKGEIKNV